MRIENFVSLPSTQDYCKEKKYLGEDLLVTAEMQTGGKGTKGRSFSSNKGGVYLSKLSFYENFFAKDAFEIMAGAAVAVCETLRAFGLDPLIKWPNDVYVNDKKIAGILIENVFSGNRIASSIVGIGLNVCNQLPPELEDIATTMALEGKMENVARVRERLIWELNAPCSMEKYLAYLGYMGREVELIINGERIHGTLLSVNTRGELTACIKGEERVLTAAEVSVRMR